MFFQWERTLRIGVQISLKTMMRPETRARRSIFWLKDQDVLSEICSNTYFCFWAFSLLNYSEKSRTYNQLEHITSDHCHVDVKFIVGMALLIYIIFLPQLKIYRFILKCFSIDCNFKITIKDIKSDCKIKQHIYSKQWYQKQDPLDY